MVPVMFVRLLKLPEVIRARYDVSSLEWVVHAAAPCPPEIKRRMIEWWGPVIYEYYGATETGPLTVHDSAEALAKPGTVGRAVEGATLKVFDPDGNELGVGEVGEVYGRLDAYPGFTYHNRAEERDAVGRDGLVTCGDVGLIDEDGYLFLRDRSRDMVISGGVNIYPTEIEAVLLEMPGIRDCAVFGIPDEEFGEAVCAVVEPAVDGECDESAIRTYLGDRIARYKIPQRIEFMDFLPREDSGKVFKRKLREPYWRGHEKNI
jgi:long-chain acyl-CoA synthetase